MDLTAWRNSGTNRKHTIKLLRIMKLLSVFLLGACLQLSAGGYAQKVTLSEKNASLQKIFRQIHRQTGYQFFYEDALLDRAGRVDIQVKDMPLEEALRVCFRELPLAFKVINQTIVVSSRPLVPGAMSEPVPAELPPPITIRGIILNEKLEPVPGVSVIIKGTQRGVTTDNNGYFMLNDVDENAILLLTATNIEPLEVSVAGKTNLTISIKTRVSQLDDVQIIGYGQTTRRLKTGSVSSVKSETFERQPVANPIQAIQGRVAGVSITQTNGSIGSGMEIQVRGVGTITAGNQPLIIVDGAILPEPHRGLGTAIGGYMTWGSTTMNTLNPNDIESLEVLKDADATAIYGSRGANGVILITTKRAKLGKTKFTLDASTWSNSATYLPQRMNTADYLLVRRDAFAMGNHNPTTGVAINPITPTAANAPDLVTWDQTAYTNWPEFEFGNRAPAYNLQASLSGGDKRINFYASAGYLKQNDITRGSPNQERISGNLNLNHTSYNDRLKITFNTSYVVNKLKPSRGGGSGGAIQSLPPNMPKTNADGTSYWPLPTITQNSLLVNPLNAEEARTNNVATSLIANSDISYRIYKGLHIKAQFGYNNQLTTNESITPSTAINPLNPGSTVPNSSWSQLKYESFNFEPQLSYTGQLFKGKIDALVGSTFFDRQSVSNNLSLDGFTSDLLLYSWSAASSVSARGKSSNTYRFNSVFGRLNYNWENRYLVNITWRRDGSSRFGPKNQWGNFGALGLGWIFTRENWFKDLVPGLSYGKLRGSYGTTGNDNIADYRFTNLYSSNVYNGNPGLSPSYLTDSTISWETSKKLDLALELGFLKDRILVSANWYRSLSTDLLVTQPVPSQTGFTSFITNIPAVVENKGWEFELTTRNTGPNSKFQWRTNFNLSLLKNRLKEFPDLDKSSYANRLKIGLPINSPRFPLQTEWTQIYEGVDPATGLPRFTDINKDGLINNNDRPYIGSAIPRTFGGLGNTLSYKGFELDVFFQFSQQLSTNWLWNSTYPGQLYNPVTDWYGNYWKQPGDVTRYPRLFTGVSNSTTNLLSSIFPFSSAGLNDIMYIRLKNLSLSYSLPEKFLAKARISRMMVYVRGQNLWTWTSDELFKDPELIQLRGGQMLKTWTGGIQITF